MNLFKWLWLKIFPLEIVEIRIPENVYKFKARKGKWTHYAITINWWQSGNLGGNSKIADFSIWKGGKLAIRYMLDEVGTFWLPKKKLKGSDHQT